MDLRGRLDALAGEVARVRAELAVIDDQVVFQRDVAEDARLRALVSETPLAERASREATQDLARLERSRAEAQARLDDLRAEQDRLLEAMIAEKPTP